MSRTSHRTVTALTLAMALILPAPALAASGEKPQAPADAQLPMSQLKVTRDQAVALARQYFQVPKELGEPNVNVYQNKDDATWNINWYSRGDMGGKYAGYSYSVSIDAATGDVRNYYRSQPMTDDTPEVTLSREEALVKAQSWLDLLAGTYKSQMQYMDNQNNPYTWYGSSYNFTWQRTLFGYPVGGSAVSITINAATGELDNYNFNWQRNLDYVPPGTLLDKEKAESIFRDNMSLELQYQYFMKPGTDTGEWRLVYRPAAGFPLISQDGKALNGAGQEIDLKTVQTRTPVPAPDTPWQAPDQPLTGEQALAMAQKVAGKSEAPTNSNYMENGDKTKNHVWSFSWYKPDPNGDGTGNADVQVDADHGLVTSFNKWGNYQPLKADEKPKLTRDEAQKVAIDFVRTARPDLAGKTVLLGDSQSIYVMAPNLPPTYRFQFTELKNGIRIVNHEFSVEVDVRTGEVRSFYSYFGPEMAGDFPAATDLQPPAEAVKSLLQAAGLTQSWYTFWTPPTGKGDSQPQSKTTLVWSLKQNLPLNAIDAKTGIPIDYNGRDVLEAAKRPSDIEGNFAQREIELLWARGTFELKDGKFNPNDAITLADLSRWLVTVKGMAPFGTYDFAAEFATAGGSAAAAKTMAASPAAPYVAAALRSKIVLPEDFPGDVDPNGPVSRELFALWAVRALGYDQIAKMPVHIEMTFTDKDQVDAKYANAVAILGGLGLVKGNADGKFEPQRALTRAEAAKLLYAITVRPRMMMMK